MGRMTFVAQRLLQLIPVAIGVTIICFFMIHLIPGDPARTILGIHATPARGGPAAPAVGPEPPADQPVLAVPRPAAARQPRAEPVLRWLRGQPDPDSPAPDAVADHLLVRPGRADQRAAGDHRGQPQGRRPRPRGPRGSADWPRHAFLLAGVPADLRVRAQVPLVSR